MESGKIIAIESKWQKFWKDNKTFQPQPNKETKFFGTVPYPYANSALHIGHGRTFTTADIFIRFQRLLGKNVLYPMGFHISGTPVLAVADGIAKKDPKQIKLTTDAIREYITDKNEQEKLLNSFTDPMHIAKFFSSKIEETFDAVGISIDWTRQFTTGDPGYQQFIRWQFKKLKDLGILVKGKYPILYSAVDSNAVGEDDIKDGDTDKVTIQEMKYIKFNIKGTGEYLVAATLRPDSLFGATNLFVKPDMALVKLNVNGEKWIVAKAAQVKIENQFDKVELISEHTGQEFIDKTAIVPILNKDVPIYPMGYPDENHGTGIVYSSPADSPHDYLYLFELKFPGETLDKYIEDPLKLTPITKTKDKKGNEIRYKSNIPAFDKLHKYKIFSVAGNDDALERAKEELYKEAHYGAIMINSGEFDNTPLKGNAGANKVKLKLDELKLGGSIFETSRRAQTRGGDAVIVANLKGQWFLDYSDPEVKKQAIDLLNSMEYVPQNLKQTQLGYLNWVEKRPCARKRGIGTPLPDDPDWIIEPLSDSTIYQMYYFIAPYINQEKIVPQQLTESFFDYIFLGEGTVNDTLVDGELLNEIKACANYWNCVDFRYTNPPHMSNHLSFLIYHYALIMPKSFQPKNITVGGLLIKDGHKISKSKGNGIPLIQVKEKYGVDLYRLYIAVAASFDSEMDFKEDEIQMLNKRFTKWKDLMSEAVKTEKPKELTDIDNWLLSKFYTRAKQYVELMENYKLREAYVQILYEFLNDIGYHERRTSTKQTIAVLGTIAQEYLQIMTPVVPHICEEFNQNKDKPISLQVFKLDESKINKDVEDIENITQNILTTVANQAQRKNITKIKTIQISQSAQSRYDLFDELSTLLDKTRNFKEILQPLTSKYPADTKFIQRFVPKTLSEGLSAYLAKDKEKEYLISVIPFLESEFGAKIELTSEDSSSAIPCKPAIQVE